MKFIGFIVCLFAILAISTVTHGYAFAILWRWFFIGFPPISVPIACGLWVTCRFLTASASPKQPDDWGAFLGRSLTLTILSPALTLGIGWVIHKFV